MGYLTNYDLCVYGPPIPDFARVFEKYTDYCLDDCGNSFYLYDVTWNNWDIDMRDISIAYPNNYFYLKGKGENYDDLWHAYFYNGKYEQEYATIVYPEIDFKAIGDLGKLHPELFI